MQEMSPSPRPVDTPRLPPSSGLHFRCPVVLAVPTPESFRRVLRTPWCRSAASVSPLFPCPAVKSSELLFPGAAPGLGSLQPTWVFVLLLS